MSFQIFSPLVWNKTTWACIYPTDMVTRSIQGGRSCWLGQLEQETGRMGLNSSVSSFLYFWVMPHSGLQRQIAVSWNDLTFLWHLLLVATEFSQTPHHTREMHMENISFTSVKTDNKNRLLRTSKIHFEARGTLYGNLWWTDEILQLIVTCLYYLLDGGYCHGRVLWIRLKFSNNSLAQTHAYEKNARC